MVMSRITDQKSRLQHKSLPEKLFGTDGIRGKFGELLNLELAFNLGIAAGKIWRHKT